jgi:hypothetical protein
MQVKLNTLFVAEDILAYEARIRIEDLALSDEDLQEIRTELTANSLKDSMVIIDNDGVDTDILVAFDSESRLKDIEFALLFVKRYVAVTRRNDPQ